jgi:predicted DNA-binding transcriptional regulator AlpA
MSGSNGPVPLTGKKRRMLQLAVLIRRADTPTAVPRYWNCFWLPAHTRPHSGGPERINDRRKATGMNHSDQLVSIRGAGNQLSVGRTSVYGLIDRGELQTVKIGARRLVLQSSIDALISRLAVAQAQ